MLLLIVIGLIVALLVLTSERNQIQEKLNKTRTALRQVIAVRDNEWRDYIESFRGSARTQAEQNFIDHLKQGPAGGEQPQTARDPAPSQEPTPAPDAPPAPPPQSIRPTTAGSAMDSRSESQKTPMSNALILLYLGAFLFVVAAGLFVGLADFSGELRTFVVAIVAALFYGAGLYLHERKPRLKQAGVSFVAIGMAVAPLIGLSLYSYVTGETYGSQIWLATSLLVFSMYLHALLRLRSSFISYLLIFSFISLMQSAVSILDVPTYYFVWMLIITGLLLQVASRYVKQLNVGELTEPAYLSSQVLVPLSVFASLVSVTEQGYMQLAITFAFASAFYALTAVTETTEKTRAGLIQVSHAMGVSAVAVGVYAFEESFMHAALSLLVVTVVHIAVAGIARSTPTMLRLTDNALVITVPMVLLALGSPLVLLSGFVATVVLGLVAAFRQERAVGTVVAVVATGLIPYVLGLRVIEPSLDMGELAILSLIAPIAIGLLREVMVIQQRRTWLQLTAVPFVLVTLLSVFPALLGESALVSVSVGVMLGGIFALLAKLEKNTLWSAFSSLAVLIPVVQLLSAGENPALTGSVVLAIAWNAGLALYFRSETARWLGSVLWLGLPLAIGVDGFAIEISSAGYSWLYVAVLVGFMLARSIVAWRKENDSKTDTGLAYVAGYSLASLAAFVGALSADDISLQVSLICVVLIAAFWILSRFIEKNPRLVAIIPLLLQILTLSLITPDLDIHLEITFYLLVSQSVALLGYGLYKLGAPAWLRDNESWYWPTRLALFIAPASVVIVGETLPFMPISLAIAGSIVLIENWGKGQGTREHTGYLFVAAIMWMMWHMGVSNPQAYTHTLAVVFALYALWRWQRQDKEKTDTYLQYMFLTATIPLILQALYGVAGDVYGWWLIIEQVGFVLLGMLTAKKFLTKWGLYVAIGAVLYQMRELEWVVLLILAVATIGIAVYYLNRQDPERPS